MQLRGRAAAGPPHAYSVLGLRGKTKLRPLHRFGAPKAETCNPYCVFGLRGTEHVTPTTLWGPEG